MVKRDTDTNASKDEGRVKAKAEMRSEKLSLLKNG